MACYTGMQQIIYVSLCNPSDVMYGWVRNTILHILPPYNFCCSSMVDLFELHKCRIILMTYDSQLGNSLDVAIS